MKFLELIYEVEGPFITVTMNRPEAENKLTPTMVRELTIALGEAAKDEKVRAVILTGAEEHFSTGADVNFLSQLGKEGFVDFANAFNRFLKTILRLGKPIIAGVNGDALSGGVAIVAACDLAIASKKARLGNHEATFGVWPMTSKIPVLRQLSPKKALEHFYTGQPYSAQEALELGLLNRVVESNELKSTAKSFAEKVTVISPESLKLGRQMFYEMVDMSYEEALDLGREKFVEMFSEKKN